MDPAITIEMVLSQLTVPTAILRMKSDSVQRYSIDFLNEEMESLLIELDGYEGEEQWKNRLTCDMRLLHRFEEAISTRKPSQFFIHFDENQSEVQVNIAPINESVVTTFMISRSDKIPFSPFISSPRINTIHSKRRRADELNTNYFHLAECIPHLTFTTSSDGNAE